MKSNKLVDVDKLKEKINIVFTGRDTESINSNYIRIMEAITEQWLTWMQLKDVSSN